MILAPLLGLADRLREKALARTLPAAAVAGRRAENLAHRFLQKQGYTIVARNWRPRAGAGEIDLIGWDHGALAFIEVKSRSSEEFGSPDRAIDAAKRRDLARVAAHYARRAGVPPGQMRFDVVNVVLTPDPQIDLKKDAFDPWR